MTNNPFIPNVHFELIPIKNLVSSQEYQRSISTTHVGRTAEHFDVYQVNPVKVSRRDGINFVFDGQHTAEIVAAASGSRETPVWCMIYDDLNYEQEAGIFANQKKYTKALKAIEIFNANIEAENDIQLTIKQIVENYGLIISAKRIPGNVTAVGALEYIFTKYGYKVLDRTLCLIISAWEGDVDSLGSNVLKGVAKLILAYGDQLVDEQFVERLSKVSIREIIRSAKERHAGTLGYSEVLLLHYNKRLKYPLRWDNLQGANNPAVEGAIQGSGEKNEDDPEAVDDTEFIDNAEDEEEIPDVEKALPQNELMDTIRLMSQ